MMHTESLIRRIFFTIPSLGTSDLMSASPNARKASPSISWSMDKKNEYQALVHAYLQTSAHNKILSLCTNHVPKLLTAYLQSRQTCLQRLHKCYPEFPPPLGKSQRQLNSSSENRSEPSRKVLHRVTAGKVAQVLSQSAGRMQHATSQFKFERANTDARDYHVICAWLYQFCLVPRRSLVPTVRAGKKRASGDETTFDCLLF